MVIDGIALAVLASRYAEDSDVVAVVEETTRWRASATYLAQAAWEIAEALDQLGDFAAHNAARPYRRLANELRGMLNGSPPGDSGN